MLCSHPLTAHSPSYSMCSHSLSFFLSCSHALSLSAFCLFPSQTIAVLHFHAEQTVVVMMRFEWHMWCCTWSKWGQSKGEKAERIKLISVYAVC